jgi:serpin B
MAYAGARGQTAEQMRQSLGLSQADGSLHAALGALALHVQSLPGARLEIASSLWPQDGFPFLAEYLDLLQSTYQSALVSVDYITQPEAARLQINAWAEEHTAGRIENLLPPGVLTPLTRLVLANAIYFKGTWEKPFNPQHTREEPFACLDGVSRALPTMRQALHAGYAQNGDVQVLALPFEGHAFEMVFILPTQPDGLPALEANLTDTSLAPLLTGLRSAEVQVLLPVFRLESMFDLKQPLQALGMQHAFNPRWADFSGMTGERDLFISEAVHKAFVEVNEEGAEAAAASAVVVAMRAVVKPPLVFRADHPFLFLIREAGSGLVLFLGRFGGSP